MSDLVNQDMLNRAYNLCAKGGYLLEKFIARGGFGVVHTSTRASDRLKCAAKICPYTPEVPRMYETDFAVILMELCDESLSSAQERQPNRSFPEDVVRKICLDISRAIEFIHKKNIAYRDMKTENIMIKTLPNGLKTYKLADFGTAKKNNTQNSSMKSFIGTAAYMAPDVFDHDSSGYTSEVDCWGLGITAYSLLTGKFPYDVNSRDEAYASITNDSVSRYYLPKDLNVSKECRDFVDLLLIKDPSARLKTGLLLKNSFIKTFDLDMYSISATYSPLPTFELNTIEIEQGEPMYKTWNELIQSSSTYVLLDGQLAIGSTPFQRITRDSVCFKYDKATLCRISGEINTSELVKNMDLSVLYPSNFPEVPGETLDMLLKRLRSPISLTDYLMSFLFKTQFTRSLLRTKKFIIYALDYLKECAAKIVDAYNAVPSHSHCQISVEAADTSTIFAILDLPNSTKNYTSQHIPNSRYKIKNGVTTEAAEVSKFLNIFKDIFDKVLKLFEFKYVQSDFETAKRLWNSLVTVLSFHDKISELISISDKRSFTPATIKVLEDGVDFLSKNFPRELKIAKVVPQNDPPFFVPPNISYSSSMTPPPFMPDQSAYPPVSGFVNNGTVPPYSIVIPGSAGSGDVGNYEMPMNGVGNCEMPMNGVGSCEMPINGNSVNVGNYEMPMNGVGNSEMPMNGVGNFEIPMNGVGSCEVPMNGNPGNLHECEAPMGNFQTVQTTPANSFNNVYVVNYGGSNPTGSVEIHPPQGISREREAELLNRIRELEMEVEKYKNVCKDYFELVKSLTSEN